MWGGAAAAMVLIALWVVSGHRGFVAVKSGWCGVYLASGKVAIYAVEPTAPTQFRMGSGLLPHARDWNPWAFALTLTKNRWPVGIPLWALVVLAVLVAAGAWRLDVLARRRRGVVSCPKCGYDRAGLAAGLACPECGAVRRR